MTLTITLVAVVVLASLASTLAAPTTTPEPVDGNTPQDDYKPQDEYNPLDSIPDFTDPHHPYSAIPLGFELPRIEDPIPFYAPEPIPFLTAPHEDQEPNHYLVPIPSQDLVAPGKAQWNPDNDPKLYYEIPAFLTKQELPTHEYPKKYNKDIHSKEKPFSSKPKQEIVLEPIDEKQYEAKQRELHKVYQQAAKKDNQKEIEAEQAEQAVQV